MSPSVQMVSPVTDTIQLSMPSGVLRWLTVTGLKFLIVELLLSKWVRLSQNRKVKNKILGGKEKNGVLDLSLREKKKIFRAFLRLNCTELQLFFKRAWALRLLFCPTCCAVSILLPYQKNSFFLCLIVISSPPKATYKHTIWKLSYRKD